MTDESKALSRWLTLPLKVHERIGEHGLADTLKWAWSHLDALYREWSLGINTQENVEVNELGYEAENNGYEPISYACFDTAIQGIPVEPGKSVFIDYGCGRGRAVVLAATHPFRRVIGVEMSPELCAAAEENVRRSSRKLKCKNVEIVCSDATHYELPPDVTTIFLWNSFTGDVLSATLERVRESITKTPRAVTLIYLLPFEDKDVLRGCDWLRSEQEIIPSFWTGIRIYIYKNNEVHSGGIGLRSDEEAVAV